MVSLVGIGAGMNMVDGDCFPFGILGIYVAVAVAVAWVLELPLVFVGFVFYFLLEHVPARDSPFSKQTSQGSKGKAAHTHTPYGQPFWGRFTSHLFGCWKSVKEGSDYYRAHGRR